MKSPELTEFFSLLGKAKKEKKEEFDNLLKEADINLDVLTSTVVTGIKEAKVNIKKQKKKEEKLIEQLDSIIDTLEKPKEVKDITEPAVTVGVPEDFDISKLEEDEPLVVQDWNNGEDIKFTEVDTVDIIKPEPIKTPEISDTVAQAIKFIEETNLKEEIENSDETSVDNLKAEIKQVRDILYKVLSHGPGSGEVNLLKLDDVDEDSAKVDGKFLKYESSSGKFVGADASGGGSENIAYTGIVTAAQFSGYSHLIAPYASTKTITVKVASKVDGEHRYYGSGSGQGYVLDNVQSPFLTLTPGRTYRFDVSDSSNSGHPFRFYYDAGKTTQYTTGVTVGSGYVDLEVTDTTPTVLHYQCSSHGYMGNAIQVNSNVVDTPSGGTVRGTLTATAFSGPLTGNVTGDVTGDLTGDVTGDITSSGNSQFTNRLQLKSTDGTPARLDFYCESSNAHYLRLQAPPHAQFSGNPTVVLPNSAGTLLLSDGSGASLTNLNASNISSGTIGAARIPTLNQDTTGTSAGLTGTPNITVGSIIASTGTFSGNVTIGGTLTYEDVTNIDSVGLITARSGIKVGSGITLSPDGDGFFTGVTTATTFVGALTGTASNATQLNSQAASYYLDYDNFSNTPTIPTNNNQLTNGAGYITGSALNASNLSSGTIPDARFPSTLPAIDGSALTGIAGTANVRTGILDVAGIATFRDTAQFDGSIGVGIANPSQKIHIDGGNLIISNSAAPQIRLNSSSADGSSTRFMLGLSVGSNNFINGSQSNDTCFASPSNMLFGIGGTRKFRIKTNDVLTDVDLIPSADNQRSLGRSNVRWSDLFAVDATFSGNVSIAGTLTYEDVTNVDSVGVITARSGVLVGSGITLSPDGNIFAVGVSTFADDITVQKHLKFGDSPTGSENLISFGAGDDLNIFHSGNGSFIREQGTGGLAILTNQLLIRNAANNEELIKASENSSVELYFNNTKRFETTNTGITVTGTAVATSFTGDLTGDVTGTASNATLAVSAQGLTGSPNITVTDVNAVDAIISGNLSVAGTITSLDQNDILATGIITASSGVDLGDPGIITLSSDTLTTTSSSQDTVASVSATVNRSATFQVQVTRGTEYHVTTINVVHDGTNAFLSEYGTIRTGSILATFDADISGGNLRLRVTPTSTASTVFKLSKTVIKV